MKEVFKNKYFAVAVTAYAVFFITGAANVIMNATIVGLSSALSSDITKMGIIFSVFSLGRMMTLFISGVLADRLGSKKVMMAASVLFILFFSVIPISRQLYIVMAAAFFAGAANGMGDASGIPLLLNCFKNNGVAAVSFTQLFFGVGAFCTPLAVGFLLENNFAWTNIYWVFFAVALIIFAAQLFLKFPPTAAAETEERHLADSKSILGREAIHLGILAFLAGSAVSVIMVWTVGYLTTYRSVGEVAAVQALAFYSLGAIISALLIAQLSKKVSTISFVIVNLFAALFGLTLSLLSNNEWLLKISYIIIGIGCGTLYSLSVTMAGELFRERKGTAVGAIATASAAAGVITPFLTSKLAGLISLEKTYLVTFIILGLSIIAALMFKKKYTLSE